MDIIEDAYPLSPLQQGLLFHALLEPGSGVDIEQLCCELHEALDVEAFLHAWRCVVARHAVLRTNLRWEDVAEPVQEVHAQIELPWEERDWRGMSTDERNTYLTDFLNADRRRGFDLPRAPLFRLTLFRREQADFLFIWTFHHAILEGRSYALVLREVFAFYEAFRNGKQLDLALPRPYRDYIAWLQQQDFSKDEVFWRETLKGFAAPTPLVADDVPRVDTARPTRNGSLELLLSKQITSALGALARDNQLTLNTLVQGAWAVLLSRHSGESDVVFGVIRGNRSTSIEGAESMVGVFLNTLPLRVRVNPSVSLVPWLKEVRKQWLAMRGHDHTPLAKVQSWSEFSGGRSLFQSTMMFENYQLDTMLRDQGGAWSNRRFRLFLQTNYPLNLAAFDGTELLLRMDFDRNRFDDVTAGRMVGQVRTILESIAANPRQNVGDLPLLSSTERHQVLVEWNQTTVDFHCSSCIHELFQAQAERTPDAIAIAFEEQLITYRELNLRANRLAHHLLSLGIGPEMIVAVCAQRSIQMVVALLGVLKAGGAYVPIDPAYPAERIASILSDTEASVILVQSSSNSPNLHLPSVSAARIVDLEDPGWPISEVDTDNPPRTATLDHLAYLIYTSGSTGRAKGVMIPHRAILNHVLWMQSIFPMNERDCVLQQTEFTFDVSVWEIFAPLLVGARVAVAKPRGHRDPEYLVRTIIDCQVSVLQLVPSLLRLLLDRPDFKACRSLRHVFCGGEAMPGDMPGRFFSVVDARLHNMYGPTEVAIDSIYYSVPRDHGNGVVPIGRPVANTQAYVLDEQKRPVSIGVPGELYLGGVQLARGYHKQQELTDTRFIADPFHSADDLRLFRTGDKVRYRSDGNLEFVGRLDFQVKLRGYRIEPAEIETAIARHPAVRQAVVVMREDVPGDKRLVAYVVAGNAPSDLVEQLRALIRARLPDYMIPAHFVQLEAMPLSLNGKIDRASLPSLNDFDRRLDTSHFVEPRNDLEISLTAAWENVLEIQGVGITDNFFELGGDSLDAVKLVLEMEHATGIKVALGDVLQFPTISELVTRLGADATRNASVVVPLQPVGGGIPIYCICGVNIYKEFAKSLGKGQPVFGVYVQEEQTMASEAIEGKVPEISIEALAEAYDKAISRTNPHGPYRLAGLSFGGILAFELALRLRKRNAEVDLVILLDTVTPQGRHRKWMKWIHSKTLQIMEGNARKQFRALSTKLQNRAASNSSTSSEGNPLAHAIQTFRVGRDMGFSRATRRWQPQKALADFQMILFKASDRSDAGPYIYFDEDYGWRRYLGDRLRIVDVIGNHYDFIKSPNVFELGRKAQQYLRCEPELTCSRRDSISA